MYDNIEDIGSRINSHSLGLEEREESPNSVDIEDPTDSGKDRGVEPSMIPLVDFLNNSGYNTVACCSGVLEEHYNLDDMRDEITIDEFTYYMSHHEYPIIRQPWVRIEPIYYDMSAEGNIEVDQEYFDMKDSVGSYTTFIGDTRCGPNWELKIELEEKLVYTITFMKDVCNTALHRSDTYEEYDAFIRQSIQTLLESLYRFVRDGYVPDGIHNIDGVENFKTIQDPEIPNIVQF